MAENRLDDRPHGVAVAQVEPLELELRLRARRHRDEVAPELADEERRVLRVAERQPARVGPRVAARLAEDRLQAGVVVARLVAEVHVPLAVAPVVRPACERAGLCADVLLGVPAVGTEREELHQLARVVLVRRPAGVLVAREPDEHRRVVRDVGEQLVEAPECAAAEELVLAEHQGRLADAVVRGREPVVPDERHALDERGAGAHHPVEPPEVVVAPLLARLERIPVVVVGLGAREPRDGRARQRADRAFESLRCELGGLPGAGPEAGAPEEALRLHRPEASSVDGQRQGG